MDRFFFAASVRNALFCCVFALVGLPHPAAATIIVYASTDVGGYVDDSATPEFLAALGGGWREHISFGADRFGNRILPEPYIDGSAHGTAFSDYVVLGSPEAVGLASTGNVLVAQTHSGHWQIGGSPGYWGNIELDFSAARGPVSAFGVGTVLFGPATSISLYDPNDNLLGVYTGQAGEAGGFVGFVAEDGDRIGRALIEANGAFYALQDMTIAPEPGTALLLVFGLVGLNRAARGEAFRLRSQRV